MRIDLYEQGGYSGGGITENGGNISGPLVLAGNPSQTLEAVPKQYVDAFFYSLNANAFVAGTVNPARLPAFTGDISKAEGSATFNLNNSGVVAGSYGKVTVNAKGIITAGSQLSDSDIPSGIDWTKINAGSLPNTMSGYGIVDGVSVSGATLTGFLTLTQPPIQGTHTVSKQYVDGLVTSGGISVGDILRKPYSTTPSGFLKCNGAEVDKATYSALYSVIGDSFSNAQSSGSGRPWEQQYQINNHSGDISPWTTEATGLSVALYYSSVVVTKNRVYLLGCWNGAYSSACYTSVINADGTLGSWTTATSLPQVQAISNVFVTKNRVYLCGGYTDNSTVTTACWTAVINSDGTIGTWSSAPSLPGGVGWGATFVTKNHVYIIGGGNGVGATNNIYVATISSDGTINSWVSGGSFPSNVSGHAWFVTKNRVYIVGGGSGGIYSNAIYTATINSDGTLGSWSLNDRHLPEAVAAAQFFTTKNTAYVIGGYNNAGYLSRTYHAPINPDGTLGEWVASPNAIPQQYWGGETFVTKNRVYICAGQIGSAGTLNSTIMSATLNGGLNDYSSYYSEDTTNYMLGGSGRPWEQQYQINTTHNGDITGWTNTTSLPVGLGQATVFATKNKIYLAGGYSASAGGVVNTVYSTTVNADGTLGAWTTGAALPYNVCVAVAIVAKNKIYLIGGSNGTSQISTILIASINADGTLGTWTQSSSSLPVGISSPVGCITKNRIYIIGGYASGAFSAATYSAQINSDGSLGSWLPGNSLPAGSGYPQIAVTKNRVYIFGIFTSAALATVYTASINNDGYIGPWTTAASMNGAVGYGQSITTKNRVYMLGGNFGSTGTSVSPYIYSAPINADGTLGTWVSRNTIYTAMYASCGACIVKNKVYIFGGYNSGGNPVATVQVGTITSDIQDYSPYYDGTISTVDTSINYLMPGSGKPWQQQYQINMTQNGDITSWSTDTSLPGALSASQAIVTKNRVYMLGGATGGGYTSTVYTAPINTDGTLGAWTTGTALPIPIDYSHAVVTKNRVYMFGGLTTGGTPISTVYTAPINSDGTLGTWATGTALPITLAYSSVVVTKSRVYLLSGYQSGAYSANIYSAIINVDGTIGSWTISGALPGILASSSVVVTKNRVYIVGGNNGGSTVSTVYTALIDSDGVIGTWMTSGSLPAGLQWSNSFVSKNRAYVFGGYNGSSYVSVSYSAPVSEDGTLGTWTTGTSLPGILGITQLVATNSGLYAIGGNNSAGSNVATVYKANMSGSLNDYSSFYDGTVTPAVIPIVNDKFLLPDFSADEPFGSYSYIKY